MVIVCLALVCLAWGRPTQTWLLSLMAPTFGRVMSAWPTPSNRHWPPSSPSPVVYLFMCMCLCRPPPPGGEPNIGGGMMRHAEMAARM